jgi:NAD(P)-dependent dehydrogenase (short-subunit alcohol dehydrogenase family)
VSGYLSSLFGLDGKVALVTGAGSGLGEGIALGFARCGAKVALVDINEAGLKRVEGQIAADGGIAASFPCNVADPAQVKETVRKALERFGRIDIDANVAGIGMRSPAEAMTDAQWDQVIAVNLNGVFYFCREVGCHMLQRGGGGRIINMASIGGVVGVTTGNANYCASKGGIIAMSRSMALEWAPHDILVNCISPSHIQTELIKKLVEEKPATKEYFLGNIPLGRLGEVEDVVGAAIFLASGAGKFITGHNLLVDGGHTAK